MSPVQSLGEPLKVFILGAGSVGSLIAHDLKQHFPKTISPTFLLRPYRSIQDYNQITLRRLFDSSSQPRLTVECDAANESTLAPDNDFIENLIITTKTFQTEAALKPYVHRLNASSNILILQNGMGMPRNLINKFWSSSNSADSRPTFYQAITTHGVFKDAQGVVNHASNGILQISSEQNPINAADKSEPVLEQVAEATHETVRLPLLIQLLLETESLSAKFVPYNEFLLLQMEKLVVNCCINPTSTLFDVNNGSLLFGNEITNIWKSIITECVRLFFAEFPVLQDISTARSFLDEKRLLDSVISVCRLTSANSSSMREDVTHLRQTEIENMNGYIAYLGRKHNIPTFTNTMITSMIKSKLSIDRGIDKATAESILDV